jgi:hypothetical protein
MSAPDMIIPSSGSGGAVGGGASANLRGLITNPIGSMPKI